MKIYINDGQRFKALSGYGMLSRNIIFGLVRRGHELFLQKGDRDWDNIERDSKDSLQQISVFEGQDVDVVLQIGSPMACRDFSKPTLIYTQNALGDLPEKWVDSVQKADGIIVPGEFDKRVFKQYFSNVFVATQSSSGNVFKPYPKWRPEGSDNFSFLFVGSYSYRKGIDILLKAFLNEFDSKEPVELNLHCPYNNNGSMFNHLLSYIQNVNSTANIKIRTDHLSPEWMCRVYNRNDAFITLSRGEGWCMPVTESLLCNIPVIAPKSTATGEYLSDDYAYLISTQEKLIADIKDPFAKGLVNTYGENDNVCYEPDILEAQKTMREVYEKYDEAKQKATLGREIIKNKYNWDKTAKEIEEAINKTLINL